ncbi:MAG TPA: hypothetical protein VF273_03215 [Pelobium sp.]
MQKNKPFKVWGKAKPGDKITIKADWEKKASKIECDEGNWIGQIEVPKEKKGILPNLLSVSFTKKKMSYSIIF